ncbi:MAG: ribonuclease H-like domain-containing protein [Bacteroidetes bacterium]|jgi:DNA polymerase-3 subunit epsilon|nr:ribonuclease H-like domain-containing protein [Bacteroidota bacterium]MBX7240006.1 ribonuclease H-like domain-containing protein [Bacteroidia bacterium]MCW5919639.1 ribonuclease H-like domain-containing protein [Bacteroidota bacterium]HCI57433.1 DNA polymerase III subunit epsilon [Bacteroidota bacterium]HMX97540.1 exonuclease domain-containing protein [Bacteroidia bacterium]
MNLKLHRPLAFFDLETTGVVIGMDRIVELGILKILPDGTKTNKTWRINPEMHIPEVVSKIHGIYDKDVADCPTFKEIANDVNHYLNNVDLAGYNSNRFDVPLLVDEFLRAGIEFDIRGRKLIDVQHIFHKMEQRTLSAAYKFYCNQELIDAHSAEADVRATYEVLEAQLERYSDQLQPDAAFLHSFCNNSKNVDLAGRIVYDDKKREVFNFGKYKGRLVTDVFKTDPSYYDWMLKGDFSRDTKQVVTALRLREREN